MGFYQAAILVIPWITHDSSDSGDDSLQKDSRPLPLMCKIVHGINCRNQQHCFCLFLLGLKEKHKLTQTAIQSIVEGVITLTQLQISILKPQVCYISDQRFH